MTGSTPCTGQNLSKAIDGVRSQAETMAAAQVRSTAVGDAVVIRYEGPIDIGARTIAREVPGDGLVARRSRRTAPGPRYHRGAYVKCAGTVRPRDGRHDGAGSRRPVTREETRD
jgi:hypothetical protein